MPQKFYTKSLLRKVFFEDWGLKLVALVITLALWLGVTGLSTPATKRLTVPLVPNISNNAEITNALIQEVDIVVSGDRTRVNQLTRGDLTASLDLTDVQPGERTISIGPDNVYVNLPQGIKLVEVAPSRIAVNIEAVLEKDLSVEPQTKGQPAPGYEVYSMTAAPSKIRVRGPASLFGTLDYVQTDPIDVAGKKEDFTARQVGVSTSDKKASVLNTVVDVTVKIGEHRVEKSYAIQAVGQPGKNVVIVVYGPRSILAKTPAEAFSLDPNMITEPTNPQRVVMPTDLQGVVEVRKVILPK
ncbi:MAG: hypothetical protein JO053_16160 [Acidobacteria bacterium]|nr:hypothetical protein [Acidobacteriota bacterium]